MEVKLVNINKDFVQVRLNKHDKIIYGKTRYNIEHEHIEKSLWLSKTHAFLSILMKKRDSIIPVCLGYKCVAK